MCCNIRRLSLFIIAGVSVSLGTVAAVHAAPATGALTLEPACSLASATRLPDDRSARSFAAGWAEGSVPDPAARAAHARFAADMLAAPGRVRLVGDAHAAWLGANGTVPSFDAPEAWTPPVSRFANVAWVAPAAVGPQPTAFTPSGAIRDWGYNGTGQIGDNSNTTRTSPVAPWNANGFTNTGITAVAAGYGHSLAVRNGAAYSWGFGYFGQLGNSGGSQSNVPVAVTGLTSGVTAVAAGYGHSLAIQNSGAYAWGDNDHGQLGIDSTTTKLAPVAVNGLSTGVTAIAAGYYHSLAIQNGGAYAWGDNTYGQLGINSTVQSNAPVAVLSLSTGVTAIAAGSFHNLAIQNGAVYAWGYNVVGQLGNNSTANSLSPVPVSGLSIGVTAVAAGGFHSLAVQNGNVFTWGDNTYGELGNGTTTQSNTPQEVPYGVSFLSNIVAVAGGNGTSYALAADGSLFVWGHNDRGELGLGNTTDYSTPQHLLPPGGLYYQLIESGGSAEHALAILGSTPPAVPEPATWASGALLLATAALTLRRRLRRA